MNRGQDPESVNRFHVAIMRTRMERQKTDRKHLARKQATEEMNSHTFTHQDKDWRQSQSHRELTGKWKPSINEKLDPVSLTRNERFNKLPNSEARVKYSQHDQQIVRSTYAERASARRTRAASAQASNHVRKHLFTDFYSGPTRQEPHGGHKTRREMIEIRKRRDYKVAQETFGAKHTLGFGSSYNCGRKDMDSHIRNINNVVLSHNNG